MVTNYPSPNGNTSEKLRQITGLLVGQLDNDGSGLTFNAGHKDHLDAAFDWVGGGKRFGPSLSILTTIIPSPDATVEVVPAQASLPHQNLALKSATSDGDKTKGPALPVAVFEEIPLQ